MGICRIDNDQNLVALTKYLPDKAIGAEIGCYVGESTEMFLGTGKFEELYCIDAWVNGYDNNDPASYGDPMDRIEAAFDQRIIAKFKNAVKIKAKSEHAVTQFPDKFFDFVYIDACHTYEAVKADILAWLPKMKETSLICGHDYPSWGGVVHAVNEIFGKPHQIIDTNWMIFIKPKKPVNKNGPFWTLADGTIVYNEPMTSLSP